MAVIFLSLFCVCLIVQNDAARILAVFPFPSISHQVVFRPLVQELARRGHEVVVLTPDPAFPKGQSPANLTEIDIHDISYKSWRQHIVSSSKKSTNGIEQMKILFEAANEVYDSQFQDKIVLDLIRDKSKKFDLLLIEACVRPALIFTYFHKVPAIQVSSFTGLPYNYEAVGMPSHPMLYPSMTRQRLHNLTIWEKIIELYNHYSIERMIADNEKIENAIIRKRLGPAMPKLSELYKNVQMLFLNMHPVFEGIRPVPASVIYMGGIHQKPETALPEDLKSYLDSAKNGVIYVSFGTNVDPSTFPQEKLKVLVRVFSQLPYDVLWKWNKDVLPGRTENIKISKWLPQSDLLKHPNVKLFVTQGGLQSTDEAITAGVPLIGIPMLGDQWFNVEHYVRHKIGVRVDMETIDEDELTGAVKTVLADQRYRHNIVRLRTLINDQPIKPLDRAVWWVEYVLRHGGAEHLKSLAANISLWDYLELELVFTLLGIIFSVIILIILTIYSVYKYITNNFMAQLKIKET